LLGASALEEALSQLGEESESLSLRLLLCVDAPWRPPVRGEYRSVQKNLGSSQGSLLLTNGARSSTQKVHKPFWG
jgi:hypothetical protein